MTPTPESTERARKWLIAEQSGAGIQNPNPSAKIVNSLALEFDRIAIEAKIMGLHEGLAIPPQDATFAERKQVIGGYMDRLRTQLAARPLQGTTHTAAGEGE